MIKTELRDVTVKALQDRPATLKLKQVALDTGIPLGWIKVFATGRIEDPGVCRVATIYEYLTGKKLEV